jgi:uncharacterized repeat protein (TIGR01451 family)
MVMGIRGVGALALALLLTACGGGSGRQGTDIVVTGSGPSAQLSVGDSANFTLTVANHGQDDASDVTVANHATGLTVSGITCTASGGATCPSDTSGTMSVATLPVGASLTFHVTATVAQVGSGQVTVQDTMSAAYAQDIDTSNNTATVDVTAYVSNAALTISGTNPAQIVAAGSSAQFVYTLHNAGPDAAQQLTITAAVSNATGITIQCTPSSGSACPATLVSPMSLDSLPSGGTLTFTVGASVAGTFSGTVQATLKSTSQTHDPDTSDNTLTLQAQSSTATDLNVTQTVPTTTPAGGTAQFQATISNPGSSTLSNVVVTDTLSAGYTATVTCTANSGVVCPATSPSSPITIPTLRGGDYLTLTYNVVLPSDARDVITNTVQIAATGDSDTGNNTSTKSTQAVNGLSGSYTVFAADGRQYSLTIDFDAGTYTMSGNSHTWQRTFAADPNGDFVSTSNPLERLRAATDLLVGGHDFDTGEGVLPYVAARSFVTSLLQAQGSYDLATRNVSSGTTSTHAGTANISNNTLTICQSNSGVQRTSACAAGALASYALSVSGNVFTGVNTLDPSDKFSFMIARSGAMTLMASAMPATDGSQQLRLGVPDSSSIAGGTLLGPSTLGTTGDWVTIQLSQTSYSYASQLGNTDSATLAQLSSGGPFAIRDGSLLSDSALIYVMQAVPIEITVGDVSGAEDGLLQIALP